MRDTQTTIFQWFLRPLRKINEIIETELLYKVRVPYEQGS